MRRDIDDALQGWSYEPSSGELQVREVRSRDGRMILQIRVELGVLQLEQDGRPDGMRPHGFETYLDYLRYRAASRGEAPGGKAPSWGMSSDHRDEADREFIQFYHRRVAWLTLQRWDRALRDADHTLALMDFIVRHGADDEYVARHERFRGLVLFHRTHAAAMTAIGRRKPEEAIDAVRDGMNRLAAQHRKWEDELEEIPIGDWIEQLRKLEEEIRSRFAVSKTLREQLDEAVASEDYERAARIRDQIRQRGRR